MLKPCRPPHCSFHMAAMFLFIFAASSAKMLCPRSMCFTLSPPLYEYPLLRQTFSDYLILQQTLHLYLLPSAILYNYLFIFFLQLLIFNSLLCTSEFNLHGSRYLSTSVNTVPPVLREKSLSSSRIFKNSC